MNFSYLLFLLDLHELEAKGDHSKELINSMITNAIKNTQILWK